MTEELYLLLFILVFYFFAFFFRSWLLYRSTGLSPLTFGNKDDAHGFNGFAFKVISVLGIFLIAVYCLLPDSQAYYLPFWYLASNRLKLIGWILLHLSLIWVFIAQLQMKDSWRIGIDQKHSTPLVTKGFFSISRNPIFLGIIILDLALFMVLPNTFTLVIACCSIYAIQIQVRLEEAFLIQRHGNLYEEYCQKVNRWF